MPQSETRILNAIIDQYHKNSLKHYPLHLAKKQIFASINASNLCVSLSMDFYAREVMQ